MTVFIVLILFLARTALCQNIIFPGPVREQKPPPAFDLPPPPAPPALEKSLNLSCPQDSCQQRANSRDVLDLTFEKRKCSCDDACVEYGDCCRDARRYSAESARAALRRWTCTELRNYRGIYLLTKCPDDWEDSAVRSLCEVEAKDDSDPLRKLPVTSRKTQLTYRNYECAICNGDVEELIMWTPRVECGLQKEYQLRNFWDKLVYNASANLWKIDRGQGQTAICSIDPQMPSTVEDLVRRCVLAKTDCAPDWTDEAVRERCLTYTSYVYDSYVPYRNADCAVCNNATHVSCSKVTEKRPGDGFNTYTFAMLFDINERGGGVVGEHKKCDDTEVYDPFARRCRSVVCGRPGYAFREGKCLRSTADSSVTTTSTTTTSTATASTTIGTLTNISISNTTTTKSMVFPTENDLYVSESVTESSSRPTSVSSTGEPGSNALSLNANSSVNASDLVGPFTNDVTSSEDKNSTNETELTIPTVEEEKEMKEDGNSTNNEGENFETSTSFLSNSTDTYLDCVLSVFNKSDYQLYPNGTAYFPLYHKTLNESKFKIQNDDLYACLTDLLGPELSNYSHKFSPYLGIVSVVGLGVSLICLAMHLIAFCLVPDLQNLSGKNLASLCLALFLAYSMFIVAQLEILSGISCTVVAVVMYFCFLASFFWMNTMAFDVWRALRQATTELRVTAGQQWRKFIVYSAYSWLSPALVVSIAVIVENIPSIPVDFRPGFGLNRCWFNQRRALLLFFVVPVLTVILINILLFSLSAYMIVATTRNTAKLQSTRTQRNFRLYLRLALLMGLTWVSGIVAGLADVLVLWYVFVLLNSLQGLFIFFAFTCTKKIYRTIKDKLGKRKMLGRQSSAFVDSNSGARLTRKSGLEPRDSADSQSSHTSRTSLTQSLSNRGSIDTLY